MKIRNHQLIQKLQIPLSKRYVTISRSRSRQTLKLRNHAVISAPPWERFSLCLILLLRKPFYLSIIFSATKQSSWLPLILFFFRFTKLVLSSIYIHAFPYPNPLIRYLLYVHWWIQFLTLLKNLTLSLLCSIHMLGLHPFFTNLVFQKLFWSIWL